MNKRETIAAVGKKLRMRNTDVQQVIETLLDVWSDELAKGGRIEIQNFAVLEVLTTTRKGDRGLLLNAAGQTALIPPTRKRLRISPSKHLRSRIRRGR